MPAPPLSLSSSAMARVALALAFFCIAAAALPASRPPDCRALATLFPADAALSSAPINGSGVCGSELSCCSEQMEAQLKLTVAHDLHALLYHNFRSVHGMLESTASSLSGEVDRLTNFSEVKTLEMFSSVYKDMASEAMGPTKELYSSLKEYLKGGLKIPTDLPQAIPSEDSTLLRSFVFRFFEKLFPLVYQRTVHYMSSKNTTISPEYAECLSNSTSYIRPFGLYPEEMSGQVAKAYETTKVLLQALSLGIEVLNVTDQVMSATPENTESCREALLRLYYCPKCLGLPGRIKPCNGYCLNVMRGCLTQQRTTELDLPWSNFLLEVETLVRHINDSAPKTSVINHLLLSFSTSISDAIMYATMNGPDLEKKVKLRCGPPKLVPVETTSTDPPAIEKLDNSSARVEQLERQLRNFLAEIETTKARGLFANLAEALCSDDSFAETRDTADCWNGHRVGEYTKALVKPGIDAQKYNPELKWTETTPDPNIRHLSDKLRYMRQVVLGRYKSDRWDLVPDSLTVQQSGSGGSGDGVGDDDEDDPAVDGEGSGSGDGRDDPFKTGISSTTQINGNKITPEKPKGSAFTISYSLPTLVILTLSTRLLM